MPANFPCPCCGTDHGPSDTQCRICEYVFGAGVASQADKCSRCGGALQAGFEFCQVCGLKLERRHRRPATRGINVRSLGQAQPGQVQPGHPQPGHPLPGFPTGSPAPVVEAAPVSVGSPASVVEAAPVSVGSPAPVVEAAPRIRGFVDPAGAPAADFAGALALSVVCVGSDGTEGDSFVVGRDAVTIGRNAEIGFSHDPFISPQHCRISATSDGGLHLLDLASRNGVYVRILAPEKAYPGDRFLLGHQLLRLDNLPAADDKPLDKKGVRGFGTPLQPAWGTLVLLGVSEAEADRYFLRGNQIVFGREGGDILFPHDGFLSRQHARLRMELRDGGMEVLLEDLGSANGTYLRMRREAVLSVGDMFRVGDQIFRVRSD